MTTPRSPDLSAHQLFPADSAPLGALAFRSAELSPRLTPQQLVRAFVVLASELGYSILQQESTQAIAMVEEKAGSFFGMFGCLPASYLVIKAKAQHSRPRCRTQFSIRVTGKDKAAADAFLARWDKVQEGLEQDLSERLCEEEEEEGALNPFQLEISAYNHYSQILGNPSYSIGKLAQKFIRGHPPERLAEYSPEQLGGLFAEARAVRAELLAGLLLDANLKGGYQADLTAYCQVSIDKYIWGKLGEALRLNYKERLAPGCQQFRRAQSRLLSLSLEQLYHTLDVPSKYWGDIATRPRVDLGKELRESRKAVPFGKACLQLDKIWGSSVLEGVRCVQMHSLRLGECAEEVGGGPLEQMDDIVPLTLLTLALAEESLVLGLSLLWDCLQPERGLDEQKRLVLNLKSALELLLRNYAGSP